MRDRNTRPGPLADLVDLTKPRITLMVLLTAGIGVWLASSGEPDWTLAAHALCGTWLVAAGASALNHVLERDADSRMVRTAGRPLPAGRMKPATASAIGVVLAVVGVAQLWTQVNALTALLGVAAWVGYVVVYTPMKSRSAMATVVGAIPGAIPPAMGWTAVRDAIEPGAFALFAILFLWQLPHFLAIAWLCREDYAKAGFPVLPVLHPDGRSTARQMVLYAAALVPVSLWPSALGLAGRGYFAGALVAGLSFLAVCIAFAFGHSRPAARRVLLVSVLYLPAVLAALVVDRVG